MEFNIEENDKRQLQIEDSSIDIFPNSFSYTFKIRDLKFPIQIVFNEDNTLYYVEIKIQKILPDENIVHVANIDYYEEKYIGLDVFENLLQKDTPITEKQATIIGHILLQPITNEEMDNENVMAYPYNNKRLTPEEKQKYIDVYQEYFIDVITQDKSQDESNPFVKGGKKVKKTRNNSRRKSRKSSRRRYNKTRGRSKK